MIGNRNYRYLDIICTREQNWENFFITWKKSDFNCESFRSSFINLILREG